MKINKYADAVKCQYLVLYWNIAICLFYQIRSSHSETEIFKGSSKFATKQVHKQHDNIQPSLYKFAYSAYNITIPENSVGKTYAKGILHEDFAGITVVPNVDVKYRIISGDRDKLFKAEERLVGNFVFLAIRTRTSNVVLNREKNEEYTLQVRALINYSHGKNVTSYETETSVHVKVLDRNDLSPLFYPSEYSVVIPEDTIKHRSILKITADDADLGINGEIYYSFLIDNDYFAIHPTSGDITVIRQLKYTENPHYELIVMANDRGSIISHNSHQASKAKVIVTVTQVNFYAPDIYVKTFSSINTQTVPLICGIVKVNDKDTGNNGQIKKLEIVDGNPDGNFRITATDNENDYYIELSRFAKLDQKKFIYNLTLRAEDKGVTSRFSYKTVPIQIVPESRNLPVFSKLIYEVSIPETVPPNMPLIRLKVTDADMGKNALVYLEIVGGNEGEEFRMNPDTGMLYTQKPLDAEKKSMYTLTVSAIDQANVGARMQSSAKVKIHVKDMNDNDPSFDNINKVIDIKENELAGTFVAKLSAKDHDSGENAYISYSIANLNDVPFEIDHFTGVLKTTILFDYETMRRHYALVVRASDWGLPYRRQTELELIINIKDINDNRPQFERVNCYGKILRNAPIGTGLFTVSAIDFDSGDYVIYRLISGNDGCFNIDPTSGILTIECNLMEVSKENHNIKVSATDGTHFSDEMNINIKLIHNHSEKPIDIANGYGTFECRETGVARRLAEILAAAEKNNVKTIAESIKGNLALTPSRYGENIHDPEFVDFPQEISLNESIQLGETIAWIKARDRDLGYNGKLIYAISDGDYDSVFRIDPDNGEIQIIGYLDRERQNEYILNITVYDLGQPQKQISKLLPILILDCNDNPPILQKSIASFRITESALKGTIVFCLNATDADLGQNAEIKYTLLSETNDFLINETTGCILSNNSLDRESCDFYELHILVKDNGKPSLSAEALINISVDDINDNAPVFGVQEYIFKVREDLPRGTVIASIEATDYDNGPNADILFSLKEDSLDKGLFKIDKYTGTIRTQGYLDYENRQMHDIIVSAIDCGSPSLTSDMTVVIEVIDVNENRYAPEFDDFVFKGKIKENQPKNTIVLNITAKDADPVGHDSKISYSITGGDGLGVFAVNEQGSIRTLSHLDAESKNFYWIRLCAQDNAIVPLCNCVQVYIEVENVNDNVPLTDKPVYYVSVTEGVSEEREIIKLNASDHDNDSSQMITYKIISGNPEGYFQINSTTGVLRTTERKLDRENQAEHILEISVSDNGFPILLSTTRIVVTVTDINDHTPEFDQRFYKVQVPSTAKINETIFQVYATDNDIEENGRITYSIKSGKGKNKFRIDNATGYVYLIKSLTPEAEYEINIKAEDNGNPKRSQTARLSVLVIPIERSSPNLPVISKKSLNNFVDVTESDRPGFLVALIQATDEDNDQLWFNIISGDESCAFFIGRENGNLLLAKYLDWETKQFYNLTITVTDGTHIVKTNLYVRVVDTNDNRPQFTKDVYHVNISESVEEEAIIMQLHATDKDEDKKLFYHMHAAQDPSSLMLFRIDSLTGNVIITQRLDYERITEHNLIVFVKDQGTPAKRNFAKIIITVHDHNDHNPEFMEKIIQSKIPESATIGSKIVQVLAIDRDSGINAEIRYSIITGNVGNTFEIDPTLGLVSLSANLNINIIQEYMLQIKATDSGNPPLSSQLPVHIIVTMTENDPPRFFTESITLEIFENLPVGTFVTQLEARSSSSIFFEIINGNIDDTFRINPSTGVIVINGNIDYETNKLFNITVCGTNMASASALLNVVVHVLDSNDNAPYFLENKYIGIISEAANIDSFVTQLQSKNSRLLLQASDFDVGVNGIFQYHINNELARKFFEIDSSSGSIKLRRQVDYEEIKTFTFTVTLSDLGKPKLYSNTSADITIHVENVNDCPPVFESKELNCTVFVPTFNNVFVIKIAATDADIDENTKLRYDIVDGNEAGCFEVNQLSGVVTTKNVDRLKPVHVLHIRASDGLYSAITQIYINTESVEDKNFVFQRTVYEFTTMENSTKIVTIGLVNVVGSLLHENVEYNILSPTTMFQVGPSSGALKTAGFIFDRELQDSYKLYIEARSVLYHENNRYIRRATAAIHVTIIDVNDNCPMFVNLPYYATVSVDDLQGTVIIQIKAVDLDSGDNGEVRYEMKKGNGELFKIDRKSGELSLKKSIEDHNRQYELLIAAYDGAVAPCSSEIPVRIKVIDRSMPIFDKQFYSDNIREDVAIYSALSLSIKAESPLNRALIYSMPAGNNDELFEIDFRTGVLYVVDELDYETKKSHEILIRATDSISGIYAEVLLFINVLDANDCYPKIEDDNYNITLPENMLFGSQFLKINASDLDTGANSQLSFFIESINGKNNTDLFYIDVSEGFLYLKTTLDYEESKSHHIVVQVNDHGTPPLSSKTNVHISVRDLNDNPPRFIEPSFTCKLSMVASRGQIVTVAKAYDLDATDNDRLTYKIVEGNELQIYSIEETKGIIYLQNMQNFTDKMNLLLNISVSDGIYTTFARVKIVILLENVHSPVFENAIYKKNIAENQPPGERIATVSAIDNDIGSYGTVFYEIVSNEMKKYFEIDRSNGIITTKVIFDRENRDHFDIIIKATDAGGKFGYTVLKVFVTDVNDNSPYFQVIEYKTVINKIKPNTTILKIEAFDKDDQENALIRYIFEPNSIDEKIQNAVAVNEINGQISLKDINDFKLENPLQFFVRAIDSGNPPLHNDIPVSIQFVNANITIPIFEKSVTNLQAAESTPPGTVLTKLHVSGNFSIKFNIVTESHKFLVTENGEIVLMQTLDREQEEQHYIVVCAETSTTPILYSYANVFIHVLDENDNYPKFDNTIYSIEIPENVQKVFSIVKVTATDEDKGSNGDIRYYLDDEQKTIANIFDIDIYTGWITLLIAIDREQQSEFNFNVIATDNGLPKHISRVPVSIKIADYNDNAPQFKLPIPKIHIPENALPGTVLTHFLLIDSDIEKSDIDFYIISGDNHSQFQIRKNGELFIAKSLDREAIPSYDLSIFATDGKYTVSTSVSIELQDINDNIPLCLKTRYSLDINESIPLNTSIIKIDAIDIDENKNYKVRFYLSGKGSDDFVIGKDDGILRVANVIDRETHPKYKIYAHAQDGQELLRECVSEIFINVIDLNDNAPEFSMTEYIVSIPEDAQIQTVVSKVHATDRDFGINRKIMYSIDKESKEFFSICQTTGIVKLEKHLDRETLSTFNVTIKAEDQGSPALHTLASLILNVLDINDNPPEFEMQQYLTDVPENTSIGNEVIRVYATSKDIGVNAEIKYVILGGNEQQKFLIDSLTGIISVAEDLDFEKTKSYLLTVQSIDGGTPPLCGIAYVNISVLDINDNVPIFEQNVYRINIKEDVPVGEKIVKVIANDEDSFKNSEIKYKIERGDRLTQFLIDSDDGTIFLERPLDRETIANYILEIRACDNGLPILCNFVQVKIDVIDTNDNPPIFSNTNYSIVLQESKTLGHVLLKFEVSDADDKPNAAPYTFDFRSGNEGGLFRLEQDGTLSTAGRFNHKVCDQYTLQVRVFDNGTPPLYSDTWVLIKIIEESQYPPIVTPLEVTVNSFEDEFPGAFIGKMYASDQDKYDELTYSIINSNSETYQQTKLFNISRDTGEIFAFNNLDVGPYKINVSVTDGKFTVGTIVKVNVELITYEMVKDATVIYFDKISSTDFLLSHRKGFIRAIRTIMRCRQKDVIIITLQEDYTSMSNIRKDTTEVALNRSIRSLNYNLNVVFAVRKQQIMPISEAYYSSEEIRQAVINNINEIEDETSLVIGKVMSTNCEPQRNTCIYGVCKTLIALLKNNISTIYTDIISFVSPKFKQTSKCFCKPGYDGKNCDEPVNACSSDPCPPQRICLPSDSLVGYQCICPKGFSGQFCEIKSLQCHNDSCNSSSFTAVSFSGKSYAHYKINKSKAQTTIENQFSYSLHIRTVQQTGTLLYASGKIDYNILEIVNGAVQYRFDLGSGEGVISVSSVYISDGEWHSIILERVLNSAKLIIDNKHVSQGSAPGVNVILNIQSNDVFVGAKVRPHPSIIGYEDIQRGFIGCMANIKVALEPLPLYISGGSSIAALKRFTNVEFRCDPLNVLVYLGVCGAQPCFNGGVCTDLGNERFKCLCHSRFSGELCELDLDPCASAPCLFGGRCEYLAPNNYTCECPLHLSGKRCEYGKFCSPNPCKNGGLCEEGDGVSHCMCRGYTGPTCDIDVNECENQPCGNGATCINEAGSFRCICPSYLTGSSCGDPLYSNSITTKLKKFSLEHISGIISGITIVFIVIVTILCCMLLKKNSSKKSKHQITKNKNKHTFKEANLNSLIDKEKYKKPNIKISNLEVNQRPISCTTNDNIFSSNTTFVNNLDILRSYGSAGDELENIPFEYQKINRTNEQHVNINSYNLNENDNGGAYKHDWSEQLHLKTFTENKFDIDMKKDCPMARLSGVKLIQVTMPNVCHTSPSNGIEYSALGHGQYHWDCSDWVRKSYNPLPDITEVPGAEIDSSSLHSNDSNESKLKSTCLIHVEVDPTRDMVALNEDLTSECVESELESCIQPLTLPNSSNDLYSRRSSFNNSENEDYKINTGKVYLCHPDTYLPPIKTPSETEGESSANEIFSKSQPGIVNSRTISENSEDVYFFSSMAEGFGSNSNISVRLCEIEDSELEEFLTHKKRGE